MLKEPTFKTLTCNTMFCPTDTYKLTVTGRIKFLVDVERLQERSMCFLLTCTQVQWNGNKHEDYFCLGE